MEDVQRVNDNNAGGRVSPTEKQFLEDLAKATRLSLECYENEQQIRNHIFQPAGGIINNLTTSSNNVSSTTNPSSSMTMTMTNLSENTKIFKSTNNTEQQPNTVGFGRRLSHPDGSLSDKSSRQLDIKPRPRPFARATSTTPSIEGSIISPPGSRTNNNSSTTIQPPPTAFKRQRSLPHRHRPPNYPLQNISSNPSCSSRVGTSPINNDSSTTSSSILFLTNNNLTTTTTTTNSNTNNINNSNSSNRNPSDDLILLVSPKVTPKFDKSTVYFCDNLYSTPLDDTTNNIIMNQNSSIDSPSPSPSTSSPFFPNNYNKSLFPTSSIPNNQSPILGTTPSSSSTILNNGAYPPPYLFNNNVPKVPTMYSSSPSSNFPGSTSAVIGNILSGISPRPNNTNNLPSSLNTSGFYPNLSSNQSYNNSIPSPNNILSRFPNNKNTTPLQQSQNDSSSFAKFKQLNSPDAILSKHAITNFSSSSSVSDGPRSSLYQGVFDQLKSINEDLIDFGKADSKNILEYFDPLVIRDKWVEEQEQKKVRQQPDMQKDDNKSKQGTSASNSKSQNQEKDNDGTNIDDTYNASVQSYGSTATTAFSYRPGPSSVSGERTPSLSLYPSLDEFVTEPLYGGLGTQREDDASNFYDAYNPFEYLYTVSCSTPSATSAYESLGASKQLTYENGARRSIGFSHFFNQHPTPVLPPALPPRNSVESCPSASSSRPASPSQQQKQNDAKITLRLRSISHDKTKRCGKLYENIESIKHFASTDSEIQAFYEMVRELRFSCRHVDTSSNKGYIKCPTIESKCCNKGLSLRIIVWLESSISEAVTFTCDVSSTVDMIVEQSIMELSIDGSGRDYILRVKDWNEYLDSDIPLADYQFIQHCIKLDQDIQLVLVAKTSLGKNSWARTPRDDGNSVNIQIDDILPQVQAKTINYNDISIPLELIDRESDRIKDKLSNQFFGINNNNTSSEPESPQLSSARFMQPVKAVCFLLGEVVTVEIVNSLDFFVKTCDDWNAKTKASSPLGDRSFFEADSRRRTKVGNDINSRLSYVEILPPARRNSVEESLKEVVLSAVDRVTDSVRNLVEMYSKSFPVSFRMKEIPDKSRLEFKDEFVPMSDMIESFLVRVGAIHRLKPEWMSIYSNYVLTAEVFHGTRWMGKVTSGTVNVTKTSNHWFFNTLVFDAWLNFDHLPVCILPRESRVVFTLFGRKPTEDNNSAFETVELGWASMQCFNFKGMLAQGNYLLPFWPVGLVQKRLGPAPNSSFSADGNAPIITIEFTDYGYDVHFPEIPNALPFSRDFQTLDNNTQVLLKDIVENSTFTKFPPEDREILWEKRHYLHEYPNALPKVLLAAQLWDWASLAELHALLQHWRPLDPIDAFQLLLPCFPDSRVREEGVRWISYMGDEELINLLPQLVEALSYETFDLSPLARFLLSKCLSSLQISHYFFWLLASQVGLGKWANELHGDHVISKIPNVDTENAYDPKRRRLELMLNSLMVISGEKWKQALFSQHKLIQGLSNIALQVKSTSKDSARATILLNELRKLNANIFGCNELFPLPVSPSAFVSSIDAKACSYFNSNALPLKITFVNALPEGGTVSTIFKLGDDLRQDALTIQTIRVIEQWWLKDGLDLRVLTFSCVPTGFKEGMVEMVTNAETLCKIQAEHGVTGVFRDSAIAEWLAKMNPSTLDYRRAIDNFTLSCAAYCVVTYVLGICDRHNDNIMLTKKGHLFHIDFGKFLGDAQMFGNFKRDRTPFVLTSDMVYVINDGEKGSLRFHRFVELCCKAFRIIRRNGNVLLNLFALMATAGIPGVDLNSVSYIQNALLPECSNVEAAARFTRFIEESSQNWFTPVNFFLHSLAQLRFSSDSTDDPTTLSFVPTVYTMEVEGRIDKALVVSFQKKYDPEKYYLYTIKMKRRTQADWSFVHRTYKEFLEFHTKMCINFPMAVRTLKTLPRGAGLGRSNVKQVAARRKVQLQIFMESLFSLADEISHSNLVYTFFHPLLRDEEQHLGEEFDRRSNARASLTKSPSRIHGQIKLSLEYQRGALLVLVLHAVDLACPNGQPPSPYVKMYLQPDSGRVTKRKTRVVRRSQHPTFMEMIEYRLPLEIIRQKTLQASVWHHDSLQENNFLGGVSIKLSTVALDKETTETYVLGNITTFG